MVAGYITSEALLMGQQCQTKTFHGFIPCSLQSKHCYWPGLLLVLRFVLLLVSAFNIQEDPKTTFLAILIGCSGRFICSKPDHLNYYHLLCQTFQRKSAYSWVHLCLRSFCYSLAFLLTTSFSNWGALICGRNWTCSSADQTSYKGWMNLCAIPQSTSWLRESLLEDLPRPNYRALWTCNPTKWSLIGTHSGKLQQHHYDCTYFHDCIVVIALTQVTSVVMAIVPSFLCIHGSHFKSLSTQVSECTLLWYFYWPSTA